MTEDELEAIREEKREKFAGPETADESETAPNEAKTAPGEPVHVGSVEEFSTLTTEYDVVLVDFYADWCGPCTMLEPTIAAIAEKTDAAVAKVDIDEHQGLAAQYGVRGVPTLLLFADGEQVEQVVGVQDEAKLTSLVERHA
jgi:thioredoxin 1